MAVKKSIICGNCRALIYGDAVGKCPTCRNEFNGKEVGVPVAVELRMESRRLENEVIDRLKSVPFQRKSLSAGERKKGFLNIFLGVVIPPLILLFGLWVINNFKGPGVIFFGYGSLFAAPIFAVLLIVVWGINVLVREPRKKNAKAVFKWIWQESYRDALTDGSEKSFEYAYGSVIRCVPNHISDTIDKNSLKEYLSNIRNTFERILDEKSKGLDTSCKWKNGAAVGSWTTKLDFQDLSICLDEENELKSGIKEATGSFTITRILSHVSGDDTYELHLASIFAKIHNYYVKNGNFWFTCDLMPKIVEDNKISNN